LDLKYSLKFINIQRVKNNRKKIVSNVERESTLDQTVELEDQQKDKDCEVENEKQKHITKIDEEGYLDIDQLENEAVLLDDLKRKATIFE